MTRQFRSWHTIAILLALSWLGGACHSYYKTNTAQPKTATETGRRLDSLQRLNKYFILRNGDHAYAMTNCLMNDDKTSLSCTLLPLPGDHLLHLIGGVKRNMQYRRTDPNNRAVLREVHFYTLYDTAAKEGKYQLALDRVHRIEVIEHDKKRTTNSYVIGALGYTAGAAIIAGIIIAATKSSCPFVSAYHNGNFVLQGEIYGGAIYPQLARHDFMPLKMSPAKDGSLLVKISNELQERQYTDMALLSVITHDSATQVWTDPEGKLYSITDPRSPLAVKLNEQKRNEDALHQRDDFKVLHMDDSSAADARNELVLRFNNPGRAGKAKLLLSLKNSYWLDFLYGELAKGFGNYYAAYIKEQKTKPAAELIRWTHEQQIPLRVSIREKNQWKDITIINTIGPLANRDLVVPVELSDTKAEDVEIKLSAGFMFWEIDYAAMDFSEDRDLDVAVIAPKKAFDEKNKNVLPELQKEDGAYLDQPDIGNIATILFQADPLTDARKKHTYILHTKGYYEHIRDFNNKPNLLFLSQFKKPNAFPVFGMKRFQQLKDNQLQLLTSAPLQ